MARDQLDMLLRLRQLAVQDRMRELALAMRTEEEAGRTQAASAQTLAQETAKARSLAEGDAALAGFVPWRARATQAVLDADAQLTAAGEASRTAQAMLGEARGAVRAMELAIERRNEAAELGVQRSAQHALDDATRRPGGTHR
jgi:hypothetical protein